MLVLFAASIYYIRRKFSYMLKLMERQHFLLEERIQQCEQAAINATSIQSLNFSYPVPLGGFSIDPHHARLLLYLLQTRKPLKLLELGSGTSTAVISKALKSLKVEPVVHVAIDHNEGYLKNTKDLVQSSGGSDSVLYFHCPLRDYPNHKNAWYDISNEIKNLGPFDFILVDGPIAYPAPNYRAREPSLHELEPFLSSNGVLLLDDANRVGETEIEESWKAAFPSLKFQKFTDGKGVLAVSRLPLF